MSEGGDHRHRCLVMARDEFVEPSEPRGKFQCRHGRSDLDEFGAHLVIATGASYGVGRQIDTRRRPRYGDVEACEGLSGGRQHEVSGMLRLGGGLHRAAQRPLERVGLLGPRRQPDDQLTHDVDGDLGAVQRGAGPRPAHTRLGGGLRDAPSQRVVPAQFGAGFTGTIDALAHLGQIGRAHV